MRIKKKSDIEDYIEYLKKNGFTKSLCGKPIPLGVG